jgi:hypothetical protein
MTAFIIIGIVMTISTMQTSTSAIVYPDVTVPRDDTRVCIYCTSGKPHIEGNEFCRALNAPCSYPLCPMQHIYDTVDK